jgi:DNA-binding MarR family transcriptional regulator
VVDWQEWSRAGAGPTGKGEATATNGDSPLIWLIWETYQHTRQSVENVVRAHGVTAAQLGILNRLAGRSGLSGAEVARLLLITPQAAHVALRTLERKGLIERKQGPAGGRAVRSVLTEEGRRTVEACRSEWRKVERRLVAALTPEERATLTELLQRYNQRTGGLGG